VGRPIRLYVCLLAATAPGKRAEGRASGGIGSTTLKPRFWGAHWGSCRDRYGVRWMFNHANAQA
jgi:uncharacterized glyoxalase superfamily protein PhnB